MAPQTPTLDVAKLQEYVNYIMFKGGCIADIRGITSDELNAVYAIAYTEYGQRHYEKAEKLFQFLCMFDHRQEKHWMGLGATRQQLGKAKEAALSYVMAGILKDDDPLPPLQFAECMMALGQLDPAEHAVKLALHAASQDPRFAKAKARAEALANTIRARREHEARHPD